MENATSFDLNRAIQQWREGLALLPASRGDNISELESRLRNSIVEARASGLSNEEAFQVAVRRVGGDWTEMDSERINLSKPWAHRIMWMLIGFQIWIILSVIYQTSVLAVLYMTGRLRQLYEGHGSVAFALMANSLPILIFAGIAFGGWKVFRKSNGRMRDAVESLSSRPAKMTVVLVVAAFCVILLSNSFSWYCARVIHGDKVGGWGIHWISGFLLLPCAVCSVLTVTLARQRCAVTKAAKIPNIFDLNIAIQRWRENLAVSPAFRNENLDELDSHLRDSIGGLQMQGLSSEEAFMIATKRIGRNALLEKEFTKLNSDNVWLERIMWLLIGFQGWMILSPLHGAVGGTLQTALMKWWPGINESVYLVVTNTLPFLLVAGIVAIGWARVLKSEQARSWLTGLMRRPARMAILLLVTCICSMWLVAAWMVYGLPIAFSLNSGNNWKWVVLSPLAVIPQFAVCAALTVSFARRLLRNNPGRMASIN